MTLLELMELLGDVTDDVTIQISNGEWDSYDIFTIWSPNIAPLAQSKITFMEIIERDTVRVSLEYNEKARKEQK